MSEHDDAGPLVTEDELDQTANAAAAVAAVPQVGMALVGRQDILKRTETVYDEVLIPEWRDGDGPIPCVRLRSLTAAERDAFESSLITGKGRSQKTDTRNLRAKLVALTAVDAQGNRLFTMKDVDSIGRVNAAIIDRMYEKAAEMSGIREKDVEELVGDSERDQLDS